MNESSGYKSTHSLHPVRREDCHQVTSDFGVGSSVPRMYRDDQDRTSPHGGNVSSSILEDEARGGCMKVGVTHLYAIASTTCLKLSRSSSTRRLIQWRTVSDSPSQASGSYSSW